MRTGRNYHRTHPMRPRRSIQEPRHAPSLIPFNPPKPDDFLGGREVAALARCSSYRFRARWRSVCGVVATGSPPTADPFNKAFVGSNTTMAAGGRIPTAAIERVDRTG